MSEEQACLVRPRSDSETSSKLGSFGSIARAMAYTENRTSAPAEGSGEPANAAQLNNQQPLENNVLDSNESGELIDYNESGALAQFHEDALRQAGCGIYQLRVLLATGLAVMGSSLELSAIPFILPSAEIEMCILPHEKSWLVTITMFGLWAGGFGWGALAERGGRRRALVSALAVNSVFATIAAFMPTYGTAMMARFCSAIGSGGIIPTVYSYMGEFSPRAHRNKALAPLVLFMAMGGLYASGVARALLPYTGPETMKENKQHFSAWHRYLLLCTLPILAALVCLIWTQESPRYLLEVGREHDACSIYQNIHSSNKILICGNKMADINAGADCRLGELSLPSKRRAVPVHRLRHSLKMFWQAFFQLFSSTYRTQTFTLGGILLLALSLQFYLSAYIPTTVLRMENEQFDLAKRIVQNDTFENQIYNRTIENIEYTNSSFVNCTFRDMFMSHVTFRNCSFLDVTFSNIKTSYTSFKGALFVNSSIIDTDITPERDMDDGCVLNGTTVRGMNGGCGRRADLTSQIYGVCREQTAVASATVAAALAALAPSRFRPPFALSSACVLLSPALHWATSETSLYTIEAVFRFFITLLLYGSCVAVVQSYPASLRCTAHGLLMSVAYMGALVARSVGSLGGSTIVPALVAAAMSVACAAVATRTTCTDNYHM